jgi:hypothetical protein
VSGFRIQISGKGVEAVLKDVSDLPAAMPKILSMAVNRTADRERTESARALLGEYAWPKSYLAPATGRLVVSRRASESIPEATIRARWRPTSLARFVDGAPGKGLAVRVRANKGPRLLNRAFLVRLRAGNQLTETKSNLGLAVRTSGPKPAAAFKPAKFGKNVWLLYGPSVASVFFRVSGERSEQTARLLETEFLRLLNLTRGSN